MRAARERSAAFAAIAELRRLQSRASEMRALQAVNVNRAAKERHEESVAALDETQAGWTEAMQLPPRRRFSPTPPCRNMKATESSRVAIAIINA